MRAAAAAAAVAVARDNDSWFDEDCQHMEHRYDYPSTRRRWMMPDAVELERVRTLDERLTRLSTDA